ncbi:X protein [Shrew hepatitis B virus]|nr:X protein [Shrew hepatitis B virus]
MAARLLFDLDPATGAVRLRPFLAEPRRRGEQTPRPTASPTTSALSSFLGSRSSWRRLPSCADSPFGPCTLRFTFAELGNLQTPMNSVTFISCRSRGAHLKCRRQQKNWTWYFWTHHNANNTHHLWLMCYGGCRHK